MSLARSISSSSVTGTGRSPGIGMTCRPPSTAWKAPPVTSYLGRLLWCFHLGCVSALSTAVSQPASASETTMKMVTAAAGDPVIGAPPSVHLALPAHRVTHDPLVTLRHDTQRPCP